MIKGKRKIDNYLTSWCKQNGLNVKCKMGSEFEYDSDTKTVYYSLFVVPTHFDMFWEEICKPLMPNISECDNFLLSLFHEIGHNKTEDQFSDDEWADYYNIVDGISAKEKLTKRDIRKYYLLDEEYAATSWGCKYINKHFNKVNQLYKGLTPLISEFYIKNGVEI